MLARTLPEKQFSQELVCFEKMLQQSLNSQVDEVSRKFAFDFHNEQPYESSHQQFVVWQKMPDDRLQVRLPICSLRPVRKMSVDSLLSGKSEKMSLIDPEDGTKDDLKDPFNQSQSRVQIEVQTAESILYENNDSIVSLENAHLNTTFNLSSFASSNGQLSATPPQNMASTIKKRKEADTMPEVVKEVSRESDDSLNDRSSQIMDDTQFCSKFTVKNTKKQLMNRIMPHHCLRESEEQRDVSDDEQDQRETVKADFKPNQFRSSMSKTLQSDRTDSMPFEMTRQNMLFSRSEVQQMANEFSDNPFGICHDNQQFDGSARKKLKTDESISDDDCNFDIDENEEANYNQPTVCQNSIRSTKTKLISFTMSKFK